MRKLTPIFAVIILMALAGCKSESISRTFTADMDTTWAAVLQTAEKMSDQKPSKADREGGKIVTGWMYGNVLVGPGGEMSTKRSTDIWRAIIICEPSGSGTKVSVKVEKGYASTEDNPAINNTGSKTLGYTFGSSASDLQTKFLDNVAVELAPK